MTFLLPDQQEDCGQNPPTVEQEQQKGDLISTDWPHGNRELCFRKILNLPLGLTLGDMMVSSGETKLTVSFTVT